MPRHIEPDATTIRLLLEETGSVKAAAAQIGVSRRTLHRWMKRLDITVERRLVLGKAA